MNELILQLNTKYNTVLNKYEIDSQRRREHFWAQLYHESKLIPQSENLNYSAKGLQSIFKKYFKDVEEAGLYAHRPEAIANIVYCNRMGNGDTASGDGYKYRGRGFIQLTGKANYQAFARHIKNDNIVSNPDLLLTEVNALVSALWFWQTNKLNYVIDSDNAKSIQRVTRKINGGLLGLDHRTELFNEVSKLKLI